MAKTDVTKPAVKKPAAKKQDVMMPESFLNSLVADVDDDKGIASLKDRDGNVYLKVSIAKNGQYILDTPHESFADKDPATIYHMIEQIAAAKDMDVDEMLMAYDITLDAKNQTVTMVAPYNIGSVMKVVKETTPSGKATYKAYEDGALVTGRKNDGLTVEQTKTLFCLGCTVGVFQRYLKSMAKSIVMRFEYGTKEMPTTHFICMRSNDLFDLSDTQIDGVSHYTLGDGEWFLAAPSTKSKKESSAPKLPQQYLEKLYVAAGFVYLSQQEQNMAQKIREEFPDMDVELVRQLATHTR